MLPHTCQFHLATESFTFLVVELLSAGLLVSSPGRLLLRKFQFLLVSTKISTGVSKLPVGVNGSVICQPCDELATCTGLPRPCLMPPPPCKA